MTSRFDCLCDFWENKAPPFLNAGALTCDICFRSAAVGDLIWKCHIAAIASGNLKISWKILKKMLLLQYANNLDIPHIAKQT